MLEKFVTDDKTGEYPPSGSTLNQEMVGVGLAIAVHLSSADFPATPYCMGSASILRSAAREQRSQVMNIITHFHACSLVHVNKLLTCNL